MEHEDKNLEKWVAEHPQSAMFILVVWALAVISILTWVIHHEYTGAYNVGSIGPVCDCSCSGLGSGVVEE